MSVLPTDGEISEAVHEILRTNDLQTITLRMVMTMLCERFSIPKEHLAPQKAFVRSIINDFLANSYAPTEGGPAGGVREEAVAPGQEEEEVDGKGEDDADDVTRPVKRKAGRPRNTTKRASGGGIAGPSTKTVKLTGLERPVVLAQPLADFLGEIVIPRSQIPKRISTYAKEHKLQDPKDGRRIICDDALKKALNVSDFTFFSLAKLVSGLVYKPEECDTELQELAKQCEEKVLEEKIQKVKEANEATLAGYKDGDEGGNTAGKRGRPAKKQKTVSDKPRKPSGLFKPMQLSAALTAVVGEDQLPRSEVLKKIWNYIHQNGLKDPNNGQQILCDDKLKAVFDGSQTVTNMGISKYLSAHMSKIEEG